MGFLFRSGQKPSNVHHVDLKGGRGMQRALLLIDKSTWDLFSGAFSGLKVYGATGNIFMISYVYLYT